MAIEIHLAQAIVEVGQKLAAAKMIAGTDGNISARQADGRIISTPSGRNKAELDVADLSVVDADGRHLSGPPPSSEIAMHLAVYRNRPEITAAVHAHPPFATAFAVAGVELPYDVLPEVVLFVGPVPLTDYAAPGTVEVPNSLQPYIKECNAFLLRNHGLLTIGRSVIEAFHRHETVEHLARIVHLAGQVGKVTRIPATDRKRLENMRLQRDEG